MATVPQTCALCTYALVPCILRRESCILCLVSSTSVENPLQISSFMQNKANFRKAQMNVNNVLTRDYGNASLHRCGENKANTNPIQSQSKPISPPPLNTQSKTCQKPIMKSPGRILAKSRGYWEDFLRYRYFFILSDVCEYWQKMSNGMNMPLLGSQNPGFYRD